MINRRIRNNKKRGSIIKFGFFLYFGFCLFAIVWLKAAVVSLEYELGELDKMRTELLSERKMAVAQRASFFSMGNVEGVAIKHLGMSPAERVNMFVVKRTPAAGPRMASAK